MNNDDFSWIWELVIAALIMFAGCFAASYV